jgi:diketogulonate reductase-like aldo/keto reductase
MGTVRLPDGESVASFGLGTWMMGERAGAAAAELASLTRGLELGARLIDTAEMYGNGGAETLVGKAMAGRRDQIFLVSKVLPDNASRKGTVAACERSLKRLQTDRIDLYLLHWRGGVPLAETVAAFDALKSAGKIRHWGVSNFGAADMAELAAVPGGAGCASNQVLYNLARRSIEWDLVPWCRAHRMPIMAYSPIEQGRLLKKPGLATLAASLGVRPAQLALAWLLDQEQMIVIPKATRSDHLEENFGALALKLGAETRKELDRLFPPPKGRSPLEML